MTTLETYSAILARHLPPSAATLRLIDLSGTVGGPLMALRPDVQPLPFAPALADQDAAAGIGPLPEDDRLTAALAALRPGGRLIWIDPAIDPDHDALLTTGRHLERLGFVRILVEAADAGHGLLVRGERAHVETDTADRIAVATAQESSAGDVADYRGRYLFLLIRQTPYKPAWRIEPGERIDWHAAAVDIDGQPTLLAFSSLPQGVAFMQPAVIGGLLKDIHRIAKFPRAARAEWSQPVRLNPPLSVLDGRDIRMIAVDPAAAIVGDE